VYDLKKFDEVGRDMYWDTPNVIKSSDSKSAFLYKTCESTWTMTDDLFAKLKLKDFTFDKEGFSKLPKSDAYWIENDKVKYSFENSRISLNKEDKHSDKDGWDLTWTSKEMCNPEKKEKFTFTIKADCSRDAKPNTEFTWLM